MSRLSQTAGETSPQWNFSYYINSTGSFLNSDYTVDGDGNITATSNFDPANANNDDVDPTKTGGVRELTGRIVDGQVQLFAVTGFGVGAQPNPKGSVVEVTDTGANSGYTTLYTDPLTSKSELTGVAFTPTQTVTSAAQLISVANPGTQYNAAGDTTVSLQVSASGLTSGLTIGAATGLIIGTVTGSAEIYTRTVTASDGQGSASQTFTWNVSALSVATPATQNNAVGDNTVSLQIAASGLPTGDNWTYSATALPSGLSVNASTGLITGTITGSAQTYTAKDGQGASVTSQTFCPVTNPGTQYSADGGMASLPIQDSGLPTGDTWTYSAAGLPASLTINTGTGVISGTITAVPISYVVTVKASDGQGGSASRTFTFGVLSTGVYVIGSQLYIVGGSTSNDQVQINPAGGSTGVQVQTQLDGVNTQTAYGQSFSTIYVLLQGGNENVQLANSLTINAVVTAGNGNDNVQLGIGNNMVMLANGNDNVQIGNGNYDEVTIGTGNDNVQVGDGSDNTVFVPAAGNSHANIKFGNGSGDAIKPL